MEQSFTFDSGSSLVRATLSGPFSLCDAQTAFMKIIDALVLHKAKKVLIDGSTITGKPTTMERFYYGEFVADAVAELNKNDVSCQPQFAYVLLEPVRDKARFGEMVALNRSMFVKVFDNLYQAEEWLLTLPPSASMLGSDAGQLN